MRVMHVFSIATTVGKKKNPHKPELYELYTRIQIRKFQYTFVD